MKETEMRRFLIQNSTYDTSLVLEMSEDELRDAVAEETPTAKESV